MCWTLQTIRGTYDPATAGQRIEEKGSPHSILELELKRSLHISQRFKIESEKNILIKASEYVEIDAERRLMQVMILIPFKYC